MNRGRRPQREEGRKKREGGEQQHSAALPSHFSHGRSHEKLHREATFKRSNDDYVKFCPAILPTHTPSTSRVASFFNSIRMRLAGCKTVSTVRSSFARERTSRTISKFATASRVTRFSLSLSRPDSILEREEGSCFHSKLYKIRSNSLFSFARSFSCRGGGGERHIEF